MTAIGPLTTTFRAPSSCTTNTPQIYQIFTEKEYRFEQGPLFTSGSNCFPSGYDALPNHYYSPGVCPHGYSAACTRTDSQQVQTARETALICCPTALSYTCLGTADQASWGCTTSWKGAMAVIGVTVMSNGVVSGSTTVSESKGGFAAHSIQVRFKDSTSQTSSATAAPKTGTLSRSTLPSETGKPSATDGGVSTAAAIGIGVGSAVAALLIAGAIGLFFFLRWRKMKKARKMPPPRPPPKDPTRASTYTNGVVPSVFELSEDVSASSLRSPRRGMSKRDFGRGRTPTMRTSKTSRTGISEELEDTGYLHPKAAELEASSLFEPSIRSGSQRTAEGGGRDRSRNRQSTPESVVSSSSWAVMRKDGVGATPWL